MDTSDPSDDIETLLTKYLGLVDEYDKIRKSYCTLHISAHQHLARANFSAARGVRYGKDFYDSRMQALRLCHITEDAEKAKIAFAIYTKDKKNVQQNLPVGVKPPEKPLEDIHDPSSKMASSEDNMEEEIKINTSSISNDPIRMFGILTPQSLRWAQGDFVKIVYLIPRLVELDVELAEIEFKIHRAQKYRAEARAKMKELATNKTPDRTKIVQEE